MQNLFCSRGEISAYKDAMVFGLQFAAETRFIAYLKFLTHILRPCYNAVINNKGVVFFVPRIFVVFLLIDS